MKPLFKIGCLLTVIVTVIVLCVIIGYVIYMWATYIDDTKEQVYNKAAELLKNSKVFILYPLNEQNIGPHKQIKFESQEYQLIRDRDYWEFYFNTGFSDEICFTFKDNCLVKINRHKQYFEFP